MTAYKHTHTCSQAHTCIHICTHSHIYSGPFKADEPCILAFYSFIHDIPQKHRVPKEMRKFNQTWNKTNDLIYGAFDFQDRKKMLIISSWDSAPPTWIQLQSFKFSVNVSIQNAVSLSGFEFCNEKFEHCSQRKHFLAELQGKNVWLQGD